MPKIIGTTYMTFYPSNENGVAMKEIQNAPYFVPLKGGQEWPGYRVVTVC